ncbi:hypothetical protein Tco_0661448 [Tanacetum coccineum]
MTTLKFANTHSMVVFLAKLAKSEGFDQIVDFINAHTIKYALTINPTIYTSYIEHFWATVKAKTIHEEVQLQALVDGKKIIITESIIRRDLQLEDAEGVNYLPNATIFEQLTLMATNQKFNFSKYIFESMVKNLDNVGKFLMHLKFVQVFLDKQLEGMSNHKRIYVTPSHTKKIFGNMKRVGKGFSGRVTPLFLTMVTQKLKRQKRKDTEVPQPSGLITNVADEAVNEELDDSLVRAATTTSSLEAKHDSGNINKTQSKATPNELSSPGTSSGGGPRCQETIGDTIGQTRSENVSKFSNDPLLARVLALETTKTTQANEIASLKRRGRINAIDANEDITLVNDQDDADMFDVNTLTDDEVLAKQEVATKDVNLTINEVTLAQALAALKSVKPKLKDNVVEELSIPISAATTTTTATIITPRK